MKRNLVAEIIDRPWVITQNGNVTQIDPYKIELVTWLTYVEDNKLSIFKARPLNIHYHYLDDNRPYFVTGLNVYETQKEACKVANQKKIKDG